MINSFAEEIAEDHKIDSESADDLLRDITLQNRKPTYAEAIFFQQKMGWDDIRVRDQLRRMHNVLRLQAIAGSPADREAAQTEADTSAAIAEKELPKIDKKLADLQTQRDAIERDARLSAKRVENQNNACQQLRELAPLHIGKAANHSRNLIKSTLGRDISDAEIRINELQCCLSPDRYRNERDYLETLQRSFRDAVQVGETNRMIRLKLSPAWPEIRVRIEAELAELQARLADMRIEYSAAIAAAESSLDFYSDPKNQENN